MASWLSVFDSLFYDRLHPVYRTQAPYWDFLRASYLGGEAWASQGVTSRLDVIVESAEGVHSINRHESSHLWRHPREENEDYQARLRTSVYHNFVAPFVTVQARAVLRNVRGPTFPTPLEVLREDVDRRGTDVSAFRQALAEWAMVYGHCLVLVDRPSALDGLSLAQENEQGLRTYLQIVSPLDLLDWQWNDALQVFDWVRLRVRRPKRRSPDGRSESCESVTRVITPDVWIEYEGEAEVARGPGFGFVPLVPVFADRDPLEPEPVGISAIRDVAYLARLAFNKLSLLTEQERNQCFNQLVIRTPDNLSAEKKRVLGTTRYLTAEGGAEWIAPDVAPMQHLLASMVSDQERAKAMLGIESAPEGPSGGETATALILRREGMDAILSGLACSLETGEREVWRMVAQIEGVDWEPDVAYAKDFTQLAKIQRVEMILGALRDGGFAGKAKAALQKEALEGLLSDIDEEDLAPILADIDAKVEEQEVKQAEMEAKQAAALEAGAPAEQSPGDKFGGKPFGQ